MAKKDERKITGIALSRTVKKPSNKTLKPGSMATQSKIVTNKPAKKAAATAARKTAPASKIAKALQESRLASGNLMVVKEAAKLGNLKGPGVAARKLKEANQRNLDRGRTATRAKIIAMNAKKK